MSNNNVNEFRSFELDWDSTIEHDSEFQLLPEGDYNFEVRSFERGRHNGSDKLPPCNKAVLQIRLTSDDGKQASTITHNLFLHSTTEGMLCAFFTAIGARKSGERIKMDWNKVIGAKGRCKVGVHRWKGRDGQDMQSNQITRFYEPSAVPAPAQQQSFTGGGYTPGRF